MPDSTLLTINSGSSSLKFGVYRNVDGDGAPRFSGSIDRIGHGGGMLKLKDGEGKSIAEVASEAENPEDAFTSAMHALDTAGSNSPVAIGHRIVHGGPQLRQHQALTPAVLETLKRAVHFAPLHIPPAINIIEAAEKHFPGVPQFACFDTAFHTTIPEIAAHYALPARYWEQGVLRYGFHGLSYESIVAVLAQSNLPGRMVVAHLGSGASLAAIRDGKSIDTSMGLTPTGGIPMGTRCGDLDPGIVLWLLRSGLSVDEVEDLLNHTSGLAGLSGGESDMRALTAAADAGDAQAGLALDIFSRAIAKMIASYTVDLEGLDTLVFTGGIGENSAAVRARVCRQLHPFGIHLDREKNGQGAASVSTEDSSSEVRILAADEDGRIAHHTQALLANGKG